MPSTIFSICYIRKYADTFTGKNLSIFFGYFLSNHWIISILVVCILCSAVINFIPASINGTVRLTAFCTAHVPVMAVFTVAMMSPTPSAIIYSPCKVLQNCFINILAAILCIWINAVLEILHQWNGLCYLEGHKVCEAIHACFLYSLIILLLYAGPFTFVVQRGYFAYSHNPLFI